MMFKLDQTLKRFAASAVPSAPHTCGVFKNSSTVFCDMSNGNHELVTLKDIGYFDGPNIWLRELSERVALLRNKPFSSRL